jgi:chorismate lyase/3-hydroxybenzoate synthase
LRIDHSTRNGQPLPVTGEAPFVVHYVDQLGGKPLPIDSDSIIGAIGYGTGRPSSLPMACPFATAPLSPIAGAGMIEIWTTPSQIRPWQVGPVMGACADQLAFGVVTLDETAGGSLESVVEGAYLVIFDFLEETGFTAPIRFWNYLTSITADDRGLERYRRFNIGRHQAFAARLKEPVPPVASAVGGQLDAPLIYFLAAREPARPVENPRQVSAYAYPPIYGPSSPGFSRASIHEVGATQTLFISGTASIVGHESRHLGDLPAQIVETTENLRVLIEAAEQAAATSFGGHWALKVYLHDAADRERVNAAIDPMFGPNCPRLYLRADMCRSELLVEIEAVRHSGGDRS